MVLQSNCGSGKTIALVIAMLNRVDVNEKWPQILCICSQVDVATEIGSLLKNIGMFKALKIGYAIRNESGTSN